jgi:hypothetical protein
MYIIKFGFLDGKHGLILAVLGSYYNFLKYIKLYEMELMGFIQRHEEKNN